MKEKKSFIYFDFFGEAFRPPIDLKILSMRYLKGYSTIVSD